MTSVHDIFLRAYAVAADEKAKKKKKRKVGSSVGTDANWPDHALVFDTETRITADQSLTFGVYRLCELREGKYVVTKEGVFFADNLPEKDRRGPKTAKDTAISDVPAFPPEFPMHTRSECKRKIFYPAM